MKRSEKDLLELKIFFVEFLCFEFKNKFARNVLNTIQQTAPEIFPQIKKPFFNKTLLCLQLKTKDKNKHNYYIKGYL